MEDAGIDRQRSRRPSGRAENALAPRARHAARSSSAARLDGGGGLVDVGDEEPGDALVDHLGHRPAGVGDDRRTAWPSPRPRTARTARRRRSGAAARAAEPRTSARCCRPDRAEVDDPVAVDVRLDLLGEVALVCDEPARSAARRPAARAIAIASAVPLSGWIRPRMTRSVAAGRGERQARRGRCRGRRWRRSRARATRSASEIETKARRRARGTPAGSRRSENPWIVVTSGAAAVRGEGERQPVEVVVDQVELGRAAERVRDVHRLPDAAVELGVLRVRPRADAVERARR